MLLTTVNQCHCQEWQGEGGRVRNLGTFHQELQIDGQPAKNKHNQLLYAEGDTQEEIRAPMDVSETCGCS